MCNIVTFNFTCQHTIRRRRSRCGGTKHKVTRSGIKAACVAESFLTIFLRLECDQCRFEAWESAWRLKLERATAFLTGLQRRDLPGVIEVASLVKSLEAEYATASWNTRIMFAHGPKPSITRVKHSHYEKAVSRLPQEIRPEDIIEKTTTEWIEMDELDYDGDYEASTDPIHPVSTDYSCPLDDDDGAWIQQHLSDADTAGAPSDTDGGFESNHHEWSWGENHDAQDLTTVWHEPDSNDDKQVNPSLEPGATATTLTAWGPEAAMPTTSTSKLHLDDTQGTTAEHTARTNKVIQTFWSTVNLTSPSPSPSLPPHQPSLITSNPPPAPDSRPTVWTDGPADTPPPLPKPRSPNSTRAWYDKQRTILRQRREADVDKFYRDWQYISRCEMRDFEGPEGRMIRDPSRV